MFQPFDYVYIIDCYIFFKNTFVPKKIIRSNFAKEHIEIIITLSFINWIIIKNLSP